MTRMAFHGGTLAMLLAGSGLWAQQAPLPPDGEIKLVDHGYRNWGPELVRYRLTPDQARGNHVLLGPDGAAVPFQVRDGQLSFVAALPKGSRASYRFQPAPADRSGENSRLSATKSGGWLEIANEKLALRVPAPVERQLGAPVSASAVPAPLAGYRQANLGWCGGAHFETARQVKAFRFRIAEQGPANITYEASYGFAPAGEYVWRLQLANGLSYATVTEEFDFGALTDGRDLLVLDIARGWSPDTYRFMYGGFGGGESPLLTGGVETSGLAAYVDKRRAEWRNWPAMPKPVAPAGDSVAFLDRLTQTGAYGPRAAIGLSVGAQSAHVLPLHGGSWRRSMALTAWHDPDRGVSLALPISVRPLDPYMELGGDKSPFGTMTHDGALPASYGRRQWALCLGMSDAEVTAVHQQVGMIGLDRYKEWVVDWPPDATKPFPRSQTTPALSARLRAGIEAHPEKDRLRTCYLVTGRENDAIASANAALAQLRSPSQYLSDWQKMWAFAAYRDCDFSLWVIRAEDALSCPTLPVALRDELRSRLALFAYWLTDPDLTEMGTGTHLGTVNMRIGRWLAGLYYASLLPDHPSYDAWMSYYRDTVSYLLGNTETVGGAWYEPPTYQMFGPTRWLTAAQTILRNGGYLDYGPLGYQTRMLRYTANLTMPDPRYPGKRVLPGMGDSGNTLEGMFGIGMGVVESADRAEAGYFAYMHGLNGIGRQLSRGGSSGDKNNPDFSLLYLPDVPDRPRALVTTYLPGYGVAFRAHYGDPDETAMLFRCGYTRSHWAVDDQNVLLYGKGAPLSPGNGHQYYHGKAEQTGPMRNQCRVLRPVQDPPNGRVHTDVQDYGFGPSADYAVGRMYLSGEELGDGKGEMEWRRHILFLKSARPAGANYFVMRDSFTGYEGAAATTGRPAWWTWLNLDTADLVKVNGTAFDPARVADEKVTPETDWPALTGNTIEMGTRYGASSWFWFDTPATPTVRAVMKMNYTVDPADYQRHFASLQPGIPTAGSPESKTIFRVDGSADGEFFYVVYPRKGAEPTPMCTRLAPGALKIVTTESTDYVFVGDQPFEYDRDGVRFSGKAGAIRVFGDQVVLCMNSGTGVIGYRGHLLRGSGPFQRSVSLAGLKPGTTDVGGTAKVIQTVDVGGGLTVRGEGPFTAKLDGTAIKIHTEGRARGFLVANLPDWLLNTQFVLDGQEWLCLRSDEASQGWGRFGRVSGVCFSTLDGAHDLELRQRTSWPRPWDCGQVRTLGQK